jgi:putative tryptophan/tyrosine transport system substrate-binding protein
MKTSLAARAQQTERMRRIGALLPVPANDAEGRSRLTTFAQALQQSGWTVGQNVAIDYRWGPGNAETMRKYATELVALALDVILASTTAAVVPLLEASRTVPIVFAAIADPVGSGFVESLSRPGGNATGFAVYEYAISGKWLELLKEREAGEIERALAAFAQVSDGGMVVIGSPRAAMQRGLIIALAAKHRLPAVYNARFYPAAGGLISYGPDFLDQFRRAAGYVDRILKGEKPADLPVQAATKYELVVNLKTAKTLALDIPTTVLARADEVIE